MSSSAVLSPGLVVAGRYRIEETLAGEGSAALLRATDTRAERGVVLRLLQLAGGDEGERCTRQGKLAARLTHPNLARVLDFGTDEAAGVHYVASELGAGGTLAALLAQRGAPPAAMALRMVQEAAAGLAAAHAAGAVHGDLHPGMLWLSRGGGKLRVEVLGLGMDPAGAAPARATARYASPERLRRARDLGPASDVFSLGVIAYEVLAGLPADWTAILVAMAKGQAAAVPSPLVARPDLPPELADAVLRALSPDAADRWPDAGEFAAALAVPLAAEPPPAPVAIPLPTPLVLEPARQARAEPAKVIPLAVPIVAAPEDEVATPAVEAGEAPAGPEPTRPHKLTLAATDLADTLYIPPALGHRRRAPSPPVAEVPPPAAEAVVPPVDEQPAPEAIVLQPAAELLEPVPVAPPPVALAVVKPAAALEPVAPAPIVADEDAPVVDAIPIRRAALKPSGAGIGGRRGLIAAGVALAVLVAGGGLVAKTVIGGSDAGAAAAKLSVKPLASATPAASATSPDQAATSTEAPANPAATDVASTDEERKREEERLKQEQLRRDQQRRADSIRAIQLAAAGQVPAQVQAAPLQAPAAVETRPAAPVAAAPPPVASAPAPAEPARSRVDPSRVYGTGEVDQAPSLANRSELAGAVARSYPASLSGTGTSGGAVVQFVVLPDGRVDRASIRVIEVSHPAFRRAAAAAIAAARFTPARLDGQAVRAEVSIPLTWSGD